MKNKENKILIIISLLIALGSFWSLKKYVIISEDIKLEIVLLNRKNTNFQVFYTQNLNKEFNEIESFKKKVIGKNKFQKVILDLKDIETLQKIKIDLGDLSEGVIIKNLKIIGEKNNTIFFKDFSQIKKFNIEEEKVTKDGLILKSTQDNPYIILEKKIIENKKNNRFDILQSINLIIIVFLVVYKFIKYLDKKKINLSWNKIIYLILFFLIIILPIVKIDDNEIDKIENRKLALKPRLIKNSLININYGKEIESWLNDHFYKRRKIISFYEKINNFIIGRIENERALVGKKKWIFYKGDNSIQNFQNMNLFTKVKLTDIQINLKKREEWLRKQNIKYYTFIAPDKNKIYGEYYPNYINQINSFGKAYQLRAYLKEKNINIIYPYEELMKEKSKTLVYWKTDTHWNKYGGYIGYRKLVDEIKKDFPDIKIIKENDLNIELKPFVEIIKEESKNIELKPYGGDLLRMLSLDSQNYENLNYKVVRLKNQNFDYIKNEGRKGIVTKSPQKYKVLIFRDSFTVDMRMYISETFGEVEYIWSHNFNSYQEKIKEFKPDIVIHQVVERYIDVLGDNSPKLEDL